MSWAWYHIEEGWDYAYVAVGTSEAGTIPDDLADPAISWHILEDGGLGCTQADPNSANLGWVDREQDGWERLSANLDDYVGQEIAGLLRVHHRCGCQSGIWPVIDDVIVMADGTAIVDDDVEEQDSAWVAEGFVRHANVLPQRGGRFNSSSMATVAR